MQALAAILDASQFEGLAITKTPAGYSVCTYSDADGWSQDIVRSTPSEALLALLAVPLPLPPCPVPLPPPPGPVPSE